jgi:hypothetical protein
VESLTDDARMATPLPGAAEKKTTSPLVAVSRVASPPRAGDAGLGGVVGGVGTPDSPRIIDVDPINSRPVGADDDLVKDQPQIDQAPRGPGHLAHRYLILPRQARDYRDGKWIGIRPLSRVTSSRTTRICRPCGPAL